MSCFRILGPIECYRGERRCDLGGSRQLALLAALLLHANRAVSRDWLIDALWDAQRSTGAAKRLQMAIARLRKAIDTVRGPGEPVLRTVTGGYLLTVAPGELDVDVFEARVRGGLRALDAGDPARASSSLREALALWRGPALAELAYADFAQGEIHRLEERRLTALEARIDADLRSGRHAELAGELAQLTSEHPYRERLHAQRMLALYRAGRQADALAAFHRARSVLVEQLGIEPSAELRDLERAILAQDQLLLAGDLSAGGPALPRRERAAVGHSAESDRRALPAAPNCTIGRSHEVAAISERLRAGSGRLLTLTGPGGVGKTRLALEAARALEANFAEGARVVSLATLHRSEDVPAAVVGALGIVALPGESPAQAVRRFLASKHLLLIMDNFEHVLAAAPLVGDWLEACPRLTVMATSREPLALRAEQLYPVSPLSAPMPDIPADPKTLGQVDAVALFAERARAHDPGLLLDDTNARAVAEICWRVDGLPLAIELAAAHCGLLSPEEIAERLDDALGQLGATVRDAPARHQTMRSAIRWSHDLLDDEEQQCFARFAVFAGGATVDAAEAITGGDLRTLERLVAKSLLVRTRRSREPTRLMMLETIRAFASERLDDVPDAHAVLDRHHRHYLALAERHGTDQALSGPPHRHHLAQLDAEVANFRRALAWTFETSDGRRALAMVAALGGYWLGRNRHAEAVQWLDDALRLPGADVTPAARVRALCTKVHCLWPLGRMAEQAAVTAEAQAVARDCGDPLILSQALRACSWSEKAAGHSAQAAALAEEAMHWARRADDDWEIARAASSRAVAGTTAGELRQLVQAASSLLEAVGNLRELTDLLASASYTALCLGSDQDAKDFIDRALPLSDALEDRLARMLLRGDFGLASLVTGHTDAAEQAFREQLEECRELVVRPLVSEALCGLAAVAACRSEPARAARLAGAGAIHLHGRRRDPIDDRLEADFLRPARDRCDPKIWEASMHEGAALSFEDAIAYATGTADGPGDQARPAGSAAGPHSLTAGRA